MIELEALLNHAVDLVINDAKQWNVHRDSLIEALLHAYNNDSSWILRYENTGELIVPDLRYDPTEFKQEVFQVGAAVSYHLQIRLKCAIEIAGDTRSS